LNSAPASPNPDRPSAEGTARAALREAAASYRNFHAAEQAQSGRNGEALPRHRGAVVWLTGLSGAGKSTIATATERSLLQAHVLPVVLDGDVLRKGLCAGLGFSDADRHENLRRAGEAALLVAQGGAVVIAALISPFRSDRQAIAGRCAAAGIPFAEVYVNAPLAVCEQRDPKNLYARARAGEILAFTGISSPYEPPMNPSLELHTDLESVEQSVRKLTQLAVRLARRE
jgi:adenylyl-sulfate kinase